MSNSASAMAASQPAFCNSLHRKILYRGSLFVALLAGMMLQINAVWAQEDRPQISPDERKVVRKKEAGPRALGVLRITSTGKATLVPITILISGKFYDASAYKASPVPMALDTGNVYEGERTGSSLGLFTLDGALHSTVANSLTPWIGTGKWLVGGAAEAKTTLKAEDVPVGIETSDGPPRLSRSGAPTVSTAPSADTPVSTPPASPTPAQTAPTSTPASSTPTPASPSSSTTPAPKPADGSTDGGATGSTSTKSPQAAPSSAAPPAAESKPSTEKAPDTSKELDNNSGAGDNNRPRLRRGVPVEPLPDEQIPGYSKLGSTPAAAPAPGTDAAKTAVAAPALVPVQLVPAISDAAGPPPHSFAYDWLKGEEEERRKQVTDFAKQQLKAYLDAQAKGQISAKPSPSSVGAHKPTHKTPDLVFENPRMVTYDLWTNNQPVMVFSAEAHLPRAAGFTQAPTDTDMQYSIVVVVRTDIYNNLHKLYAAVTDKYHLDVTPQLELVDAVDADGDGRGELLFRETSDAGAGWLIYRANPDKLWKIFDSLNPE